MAADKLQDDICLDLSRLFIFETGGRGPSASFCFWIHVFGTFVSQADPVDSRGFGTSREKHTSLE